VGSAAGAGPGASTQDDAAASELATEAALASNPWVNPSSLSQYSQENPPSTAQPPQYQPSNNPEPDEEPEDEDDDSDSGLEFI
jgi:hypothetical protein